jgi:hypothetical protein
LGFGSAIWGEGCVNQDLIEAAAMLNMLSPTPLEIDEANFNRSYRNYEQHDIASYTKNQDLPGTVRKDET